MQRQLDECPFTIRQVNSSTYLIRELDRFVSPQYHHHYTSREPNTPRAKIPTST